MAMLNNQRVILATSGQQAAPQSCDCGGTASGFDSFDHITGMGVQARHVVAMGPKKTVRLMDISPYIICIYNYMG